MYSKFAPISACNRSGAVQTIGLITVFKVSHVRAMVFETEFSTQYRFTSMVGRVYPFTLITNDFFPSLHSFIWLLCLPLLFDLFHDIS